MATRFPPSDLAPAPLVRLGSIGNIFVEPGRIYDQESRHPNALIPFLVLIVLMMAQLMLLSEPMMRVALSSLPEAIRAEMAPQVTAMVEKNRWMGLLLTPLIQGARVLAIGFLIYLVASFAGEANALQEGDFHRAVSIAVYASFVLVAEELTNYAVLWGMGWENVRYFWDLKPILGMHFLVEEPSGHRVSFAVLQRLNPFTLFYGALLALGVRRVFRTSWAAAISAALGVVSAGIVTILLIASVKA